MCVCVYIRIYMYVYIHICMLVYRWMYVDLCGDERNLRERAEDVHLSCHTKHSDQVKIECFCELVFL